MPGAALTIFIFPPPCSSVSSSASCWACSSPGDARPADPVLSIYCPSPVHPRTSWPLSLQIFSVRMGMVRAERTTRHSARLTWLIGSVLLHAVLPISSNAVASGVGPSMKASAMSILGEDYHRGRVRGLPNRHAGAMGCNAMPPGHRAGHLAMIFGGSPLIENMFLTLGSASRTRPSPGAIICSAGHVPDHHGGGLGEPARRGPV